MSCPNASTTSIMDMNDECLLAVFKHIEVDELCEVADVCTRFRFLAQETFRTSELKTSALDPCADQLSKDEIFEKTRKAMQKLRKTVKRPPSMTLYEQLRELDERDGLIFNEEIFDCEICLDAIDVGDGVRFRECLHQYCLTCAKNSILFSDFAEIPCPFGDGVTKCDYFILDSEIRDMLSADEYETFTKRSLRIAEGNITGSVHCKLPDCDGWCIVEDNVNEFNCPKCNSFNCIPCQAIHPGVNCKQYQDVATLDESTKNYLETQIETGNAMKCTKCQIVIAKRDGCDGVICVMCRTELCWATKQARWGPKGSGDYSGGCGCNPRMSQKCHPNCNNCH